MRALASLLLATAALAANALADEVTLKDGRKYQGEITHEDDASITIDARVGKIRAPLTFAKAEVAGTDRKDLPPGFFEDEPPPVRQGTATRADALYMVVPIDGKFGTDVTGDGVSKALAYAVRNRIQHVVFHVNTRAHSSFEEAGAVFRILARYRNDLKLHALVRSGLGDGLGVIAACHTISLEPGATVGGVLDPTPEGEDADEHETLRRERGLKAERVLNGMGRPLAARIVRAMLDPEETLVGWKDDDGVHVGSLAPDGKTKIFEKAPGQPLVLDAAALANAGVRVVEGGAQALGKALGVDGWKSEGDYGAKAMTQAAAELKATLDKKEAAQAAKVARVTSRRQAALETLQHDLTEAAKWDPNKGDYSTYQRMVCWDWGTGSSVDTHQLTEDSRKRWQQRSDLTIGYLKRALKDIKALQKLEGEAQKLGLQPLIAAAELEKMREDLIVKGRVTAENRDRKER